MPLLLVATRPANTSLAATEMRLPLGRRLCSFSAMLLALFSAALYIFCSHCPLLADPDIWWHLRNAHELVARHTFLRQDFYTFTLHGKTWINPEWLSELPFYVAWCWAGYRGLYVIAVSMIELLAIGCCLLGWQQTKNGRPALLAGVAFVLMSTVSFGPRTQIFGWLCLVVELFILQALSEGKNFVWGLPPLFALWINLHGSWPVGVLFLLIYLMCRWDDISWGALTSRKLPRRDRHRLILVALVSILALFLNPYGWHLVAYPFVITLHHPLTIGFVEEWQTLNFHSLRGIVLFISLAILLTASIMKRRRWQLHEFIFLMVSALAAFTYSRFLLLAGVVIVPYLARELTLFAPDDPTTDKPLLNAALICGFILFVVLHIPPAEELQAQSERGYPAKAAAYLRANTLDGPMLNDFNWGGYLEWNVPNSPMFIDTRADAFEHWGVLADYIDAVKLRRDQEVLKKYGIRYVLFPAREPLALVLRQTPGWSIEYEDVTALLLKRNTP